MATTESPRPLISERTLNRIACGMAAVPTVLIVGLFFLSVGSRLWPEPEHPSSEETFTDWGDEDADKMELEFDWLFSFFHMGWGKWGLITLGCFAWTISLSLRTGQNARIPHWLLISWLFAMFYMLKSTDETFQVLGSPRIMIEGLLETLWDTLLICIGLSSYPAIKWISESSKESRSVFMAATGVFCLFGTFLVLSYVLAVLSVLKTNQDYWGIGY